MEAFKKEFFALVEKAEHIVITAHLSPDDDSIGSVMAMHEILTIKYPDKDIKILYSGEASHRHSIFANYKNITFVTDIADHISNTDLFVMLDVNNYARVSKQPEKIKAIPNRVIIDHHATSPDESTLSLIATEYSSNSELIYRALLGDETMLTPSLAESLLLGIVGDTGNFSFVNPGQTGVFALGGVLVEKIGMSIDKFRSRYGGIPKKIIPLLKTLAQHTEYATVDGWPSVQYTYLDVVDVNHDEYSEEDISAAAHIYIGQYLTKIEGQPWGFIITPRADGSGKLHARSLPGSVNVRDLCQRMASGGGHDRASGGTVPANGKPSDGKEFVHIVLDWMKANTPLIG
jgi:phosphoesterase RecJ-like protein